MFRPGWKHLGRIGLVLLAGGGLAAQSTPPTPAAADLESELLALLNTPVTAASRQSESSGRAPATVVTVTADQILRRRYRSLGEVLRDLPEFKVDNGFSVEFYNTVSVRGVMGQYKFVILMDGNRIGAATNEVIPILENFPVHFAKQVEVVYGPASALYGADAFTGVINIVTWKGEEAMDRNHARLGGGEDLQGDHALAWTGRLGSAHLTVAGQYYRDSQPDLPDAYPAAYAGLQEALDTGIFDTVFGTKVATIPYDPKYAQPIRANNAFLRLQHETWSVSLLQGWTRVPSAINYAPPNALPIEAAHVAARTLAVSMNHTMALAENLELQSTLTGRRYEVDPGSRFINLFHPNIEPGYKFASSQSWRLEEVVSWKPSARMTLTGGLSWETSDATPWGANLASPVDTDQSISNQGIYVVGAPIEADFYTVRSTTYGLFAQGQMSLAPTWTLTLGARYDRDSRYGDTFNPRAGIVWSPTANTTVKALYGSAFLAPSPYAAFRHYGGFYTLDGGTTYQSDYWRLPNPMLKPEKVDTLELSGRTMLTSFWSLSASLYQSTYKDLHTPMADNTGLYNGYFKGWPVAYIEITGNQGEQKNTGWNLQMDLLATLGDGRLNAFAAYSHVDGEVTRPGLPDADIGYMTPSLLKVGADLTWGPWTASAILISAGTQRSNALRVDAPTKRETVKGYQEVNLSLGYQWNRWEVFLKVQNALDERYRHLNENAFSGGYEFNGMPQNPRRISGGMRVRF